MAVPNMISVAVETWAFQVVSFFAGNMGKTEIAVMNTTVVIFLIFHSCAFGFGIACNIRISNLLGEANIEGAKHACKTSVVLALIFGICTGNMLYWGREYVIQVMSNDPEIKKLFCEIAWLMALALATLCLLTIMACICIGQGRPAPMAITMV
eukprot:UN32487